MKKLIEDDMEQQVLWKSLIVCHHKSILRRMCRVCGAHCYDLGANSSIRHTESFKENAMALGIDVSNDDPAIHPTAICRRCIKEATKKETWKRSNVTEKFSFHAHSDEKCQVCKFACSACLLVPKVAKLKAGSYGYFDFSADWARKERHNAIVKAVEQLQGKSTAIQCTSNLLSKDISDLADHSEKNCVLCDSPCPLCGISAPEAQEHFTIRCKPQTAYTRVLRTRKRKVEDSEFEYEELEQNTNDTSRRTVAIPKLQPSKKTNIQPALLPKLKSFKETPTSQPNIITIVSQVGQTFQLPVTSNTQTSSLAVGNIMTSDKTNSPMTFMLNSPPVRLDPVPNKKMIAQPILLNSSMQNVRSQNNPITSVQQKSIGSGSIPCKILPNTLPNSPNQVIQKKFPNVASRPLSSDSVEFGTAPRIVARTFHESYKAHGSLTGCIKQALSLAPLLKYKYKFIRQVNQSEQCILIGLVSKNDDPHELKKELRRLDNYVKENHLRSRASAVEELLFSFSEPSRSDSSMISDEERFNISSKIRTKPDQPYRCEACNQVFLDSTSYMWHFGSFAHRSKEKDKPKPKAQVHKKVNGKTDNHPNHEDLALDDSRPDYACLLYLSFNSRYISSNANELKCYICQMTFFGQIRLLVHCWSHGKLFDFACTWCGLKFESSNEMRAHILKRSCTESSIKLRKAHRLIGKYTGIVPTHYKPFYVKLHKGTFVFGECKFCSFASTTLNSLIYHGRKHVGDFPFRCAKCIHGAVSKLLLVDHQTSTGHRGFYEVKRSAPITPSEVKKLDSLILRNLITFNEAGYQGIPLSRNKKTIAFMIMEFDNVETPKDSSRETEDNSSVSTSTRRDGDAKHPDTWMFCKRCNSAFLDEQTYNTHVKKCTTQYSDGCTPTDKDIKVSETPMENVMLRVKKEITEELPFCYPASASSDTMNDKKESGKEFDLDKVASCSAISSGAAKRPRKMKPQKRSKLDDIIAGLSGNDADANIGVSENAQDLNEPKNVDEESETFEESCTEAENKGAEDEAENSSPMSDLPDKCQEKMESSDFPEDDVTKNDITINLQQSTNREAKGISDLVTSEET